MRLFFFFFFVFVFVCVLLVQNDNDMLIERTFFFTCRCLLLFVLVWWLRHALCFACTACPSLFYISPSRTHTATGYVGLCERLGMHVTRHCAVRAANKKKIKNNNNKPRWAPIILLFFFCSYPSDNPRCAHDWRE